MSIISFVSNVENEQELLNFMQDNSFEKFCFWIHFDDAGKKYDIRLISHKDNFKNDSTSDFNSYIQSVIIKMREHYKYTNELKFSSITFDKYETMRIYQMKIF